MLNDYNAALTTYEKQWQSLCAARQNQAFFAGLTPVALGWKVQDRAEYTKRVAALHDYADQIVETWMNGRWVAKLHLRDSKLQNGISIVKIMERRPGSTDATGLDHIDFYAATPIGQNEKLLAGEPDLNWSKENNDIIAGYDWLSVWFDGTEAKIKSDTVLDIVAAELHELKEKVIQT